MSAQHVLDFWFKQTPPELWFEQNDALDQQIKQQFGTLHARAVAGELQDWRIDAQGRLAEIILIDQFSRNLYRNQPEAFAHDSMALVLAQEAVQQQLDQQLPVELRKFLYLPYMHSESLIIHQTAMRLFTALGDEQSLHFETLHQHIIQRFGRYPHRNQALGRTSTAEEIEFLKQPDSSF